MRSVRVLTLAALAAIGSGLSLHAQCYEPLTGSSIGSGDDSVLPIQSLGFAFPFNGTTYTDIYVSTNGFVYLVNGGPAPATGALCCTGTSATLVAGTPKVCPYWSDLVVPAATGTVKFNALPGKAVVTWENALEFGDTTPFSVQLQLHASGEIDFAYDGRCAIRTAGDFLIGMSEANGAAIPVASDFSTIAASATTTNFEIFNNVNLPFDLTGQTVQFLPTAPGYAWITSQCASSNSSYGSGCYTLSNSAYQLTVAPAVSSAALSNTAITFVPSGGTYLLINGGTYVAPTGAATALTLGDDSSVATPALATPFPYPGGTAATLTVCSNGSVWVASGNSTAYPPDVPTMLNNPQTGWYSWHDYNPTAVGSGQVKFEQVGNVAYVTWDGVYNFSGTSAADANTYQFQFDCATGQVTIAYQTMSSNTHTLAAGEPHLVGYSPGGPSNDGGSLTFASALPLLIPSANLSPLKLSAAPVPTPGATITYTTDNIPEYIPTSGLYIALHILSIGQVAAPGIDLAFIGAPGCAALVQSLDFTQAMVGTSASQSVTFQLPLSVPLGVQLFSQSAALITPNSLPNGQNAFGMTTSNGIASMVGAW